MKTPNITLYGDIITTLNMYNRREEDILWVGIKPYVCRHVTKSMNWDKFKEIAKDISYELGDARVSIHLIVVGMDFWLERREIHEGGETVGYWEMKMIPVRTIYPREELHESDIIKA